MNTQINFVSFENYIELTLIIETWIENNIHLLSVRNFRIWHQSETRREQIGQCRSVWAVLDLKKREIANVFEQEMFQGCADGEALPISKGARLRPLSAPNGSTKSTINYSDMDYNMHCNSCKYLEKMLDAQVPDFIDKGACTPIRMDITYSREAHYKEEIEVKYQYTDNGILYQINNSVGETNCLCAITEIESVATETKGQNYTNR